MSDLPTGPADELTPVRGPAEKPTGKRRPPGVTKEEARGREARSGEIERLEQFIANAEAAGKLDPAKAGVLRLHLAEVRNATRPGERTRALKELGTVLGIYEKIVVEVIKDPSEMTTLELLQEVGETLRIKGLAGCIPWDMPQEIDV